MLRSILIAPDASPSSLQASELGLELARRHRSHVEGLGIVNSAWIQRPEAVPLGGMAYKIALDLRELQDAAERVGAVLDGFRKEAERQPWPRSRPAGDPLRVIETEAASHDLIVLGHRSMFDVDGEICELPLCVDRVIRGGRGLSCSCPMTRPARVRAVRKRPFWWPSTAVRPPPGRSTCSRSSASPPDASSMS